MPTTVITIDGQPFSLEGIVIPFLDVWYHQDYSTAASIAPLNETNLEVATALGVDGPKFVAALDATIASTCTGPLAPLAPLLRSQRAYVTDLGIDTSSGVFVFGFCCDVSGQHLKPYGVPLTAFGVEVRYVQPAATKQRRPSSLKKKAKPKPKLKPKAKPKSKAKPKLKSKSKSKPKSKPKPKLKSKRRSKSTKKTRSPRRKR